MLEQKKKVDNWTDEQKRAIGEEGCNLLVAAAAGAGKTAVLVERIIRKISRPEKPVDIDRLLVVTFTNAAAAEMRERIGIALAKVLEESRGSNSPGSENLQKQLTLLSKASITTIHSFCMEVIRNNFHAIGLDPGFRVADETEAVLLKLEALEELIESKYEPENVTEEFLNVVECYGSSRDDGRLMDIILELYEFVQSHPWPDLWLHEAAEAFNAPQGLEFGTTKWAKVLMKYISIELAGLLSNLEEAAKNCASAAGLEKYETVIGEDILKLKAMLKVCGRGEGNWDELYRHFADLRFSTLRSGKDADPEAKERVKAVRDNVKERLKKLKEELVNSSSKEMTEDLLALYPTVKQLCALAAELGSRYAEKKREKGLIDFNDLEHYCLKILAQRDEKGEIRPTRTALDLRERFEEIYIDEYQDSNLTQEVILNIISREENGSPNVFMVGDVKQSIYRFRQAKPELFLKKYASYSEDTDSKYRKILLYKNFRSREDIINGANFIFKQIMSETVGEIDYTETEALNPGAEYPPCEERAGLIGGPVELHIVETKEETAVEGENDASPAEEQGEVSPFEQEEEAKPDSARSEAMLAAKRIKELVTMDGSGYMVYDRGLSRYRPARYSDIVILLRATKNWAEVFSEELNMQGIPTFTDTGSGYFRTVEVSTMLSLLQVIDNPMQDIPLLAVLRSPIEGFSPEELIDIRLEDKEASFYEALEKCAAKEGALGSKARDFLNRLDKWRQKSLYMGTDELIWHLFTDTGYYSFVGAMPGGLRRQANLRLLFDKARQYEESSFKGLFNFINFINKLRASQGDMGSAKVLGEKDDVVRIMSIHKSKGLEFPIVFLCGTGKGFNLTDATNRILLHHDLGIGPDFVDPVRRIWYPTVFKQALKYKIRQESLSEEMRILYVAFTRAKEKLIITGSVSDSARAVQRWKDSGGGDGEKVQEYGILKGRCYLDWICTALMRHPAGILAEAAGMRCSDGGLKSDDGWEVKIWSREAILESKACDSAAVSQTVEELGSGTEPTEKCSIIKERLEWNYPYKMAERLPVKLTVSELKRYFSTEYSEEYYTGMDGQSLPMAALELHKKPRFLEESTRLSPAEKGSIMHFVMQHLDFKGPLDRDGIKRQIEGMVMGELLTELQAQSADPDKIYGFINSELGKRMLRAEKLYREVPFNLEIKCTEVFKELPAEAYENETTVLQGIIDCYFEEDGKLVLVDYKTDYMPPGEAGKLVEKYRTQLEYYAGALEQITGKKVSERYIYSFWADTAIQCI